MLKRYISEAVSLAAEAVLGKPILASAACGDGCTFIGTAHGNCGSCGVEKWNVYKVYQCGPDYAYCWYTCTYCGM